MAIFSLSGFATKKASEKEFNISVTETGLIHTVEGKCQAMGKAGGR